MTEDAQLLAELARLIGRYGPERFARLASVLRNPEEARNLATVMEAALAASPATRKRRGQAARTAPGSRILAELKEVEPEKYELLTSFRDDVVAQKILPSFRHVRRFAEDNGITLGSASSREKAITPLLRFMAALSLAQVQTLVHQSTSEEAGDRSLARWSDVIMGRASKPVTPIDQGAPTGPLDQSSS